MTEALVKPHEVIDAYEVAREYDIVATLKVENVQAFRELLKINGVKSTVSSFVLQRPQEK